MEKFPIYGKNGEKYSIKIKPTILEGMVKVTLYKKTKLFGFEFNKKLRFNTYNEEQHDFNYIYMARRQVYLYEQSITDEINNKKLKEENLEKFNQWNGDSMKDVNK